jgi:hypothetical protein
VAIGVRPKASGCPRNLCGSFRVDTGTKNGKARRENHGEGFCVVRSLGVTLRNQLAYGSFHVELHDVRYLASSDVRYVDCILF